MADEYTTDPMLRQMAQLRNKLDYSIAGAMVCFIVVIMVSAWVAKNHVSPNSFGLLAIPLIMFCEAAFCIYSVIIFISSDISVKTPMKSKLIWWHGASVIILVGCSLVVALGLVLFSASFSFIRGNL